MSPFFFFCLILHLCLLQNQCHGHLSWPLWGGRGGQQVEHKHTCLPHPLYQPSWGCWAEGPISSPSEPGNQHCQAQLPVEHAGLTLQTVCGDIGQAGRPAGCCCCAGGKRGACQTTASLSWGSARLDGPDALRRMELNRSTAKS